jgi:hypothetical protein
MLGGSFGVVEAAVLRGKIMFNRTAELSDKRLDGGFSTRA